MSTKVSIIVAIAENGVIGNNLKIPWHIPEDFKHFKEKTKNNIVIMGRKTWESLPKKPLPNRINVVLSRNKSFGETLKNIPETLFFSNLEDALNFFSNTSREIFIIGGSNLYLQTLPIAEKLYVSHIKGSFKGDTYFPKFNSKDYKIIEEKKYKDFTYRLYSKISK